MYHKRSDIKEGQSQGQEPWWQRELEMAVQPWKAPFEDQGIISQASSKPLLSLPPELADFCLCQRLEGK